MIRVVENKDWVILTLMVLVAVYLLMFYTLQRGLSIKNFLLQGYNEKQNLLLCWITISLGFTISLSVLFSQYIPIVPRFLADMEMGGFVLNKMGVMVLGFCIYYFIKNIFTMLFYKSIGQIKKYLVLGFLAQKFYFVFSVFLMLLGIIHYYFYADRVGVYNYYIIGIFIVFIGKNLFYLFHRDRPLPTEWYYKILYICTLQILPLLAFWKFIFL